ncbi:MAG: ABC transporter ATP-binding protein/permease [Saccharofermentans sp.]|nr:ABC transporter ATP-binding protein/permease [Saccharofermentans sp.]
MRTVLGYFRNYRLQSILSPIFKLSEATFELIVPLVIASIIDKGISSGDTTFIFKRVLLLGAFALVGFASAICAQYFAAAAAAGISSDIRSDLFRKINRISVTDFEKIGRSNIVTGLTSDVNQIQSGINLFLRLLLRSPFIVIGAVVMAFTIDFKLTLIFVVAVALLGTVVTLNMRKAIPSYKKTRSGLDSLVSLTDNGLSGVKVIRGFNRSEDDYKQFEEESSRLNILQNKAAAISSYLNPMTFMIINLAICLLIYRGAIKVDTNLLTQGQVVALYNYMSQILVELIKLANLIVTVSRAVACASRVESMLAIVDESEENANRIAEPHKAHSIEFDDVTFTFSGNSEETLGHLSFKIEAGQTIGIIGKTGSGKSTVAQLAAGLYPVDSGTILIDGVPMDTINRTDLSKAVGLCLQKAKIFSGSIKYNIDLDRKDVSPEDIHQAAKDSCADDVISAKKHGIMHKLSPNGAGLSGGQKQRIGIARVLAGRPGVIILDDSTSALDAATERRLLDNLAKLEGNPTKIIISQKIRSVMNSDKILLLDEGKIEGFGSHEELLKSCPSYVELNKLQNQEVANEK